jgi:hypothetical protein
MEVEAAWMKMYKQVSRVNIKLYSESASVTNDPGKYLYRVLHNNWHQ